MQLKFAVGVVYADCKSRQQKRIQLMAVFVTNVEPT
jgi:hypothetical protein